WRDTMAHEYVHYVVQHLTGGRVPIWLHEGLAKFVETRWQPGAPHRLPPTNEDLLARRIEADDLVTFEEMHPSMALLPSQEDAGTAFAEVYTVIEYVFEQRGVDGIREIVWAIRDGSSVEEAFAEVMGVSFQTFLSNWERYLRSREFRRLPSDFVNNLQFMPENASDAAPDELAGIAQEEARNFMHLGQLLRARGRIEGSIVEYRKAEDLVGPGNPQLQNRMARALLDLNRPEEAAEALGSAAEFYPDFYLTFLHLGEVAILQGAGEEALEQLQRAASINPFDPEVHRQLSRAFQLLGRSEEAEQAARDASLVSR
ncbi:MAG: hypothetical protein KC561_06765, partial [Myxococcales bacterium]|nr:hypothetical protein [Myxococcales bacterium]